MATTTQPVIGSDVKTQTSTPSGQAMPATSLASDRLSTLSVRIARKLAADCQPVRHFDYSQQEMTAGGKDRDGQGNPLVVYSVEFDEANFQFLPSTLIAIRCIPGDRRQWPTAYIGVNNTRMVSIHEPSYAVMKELQKELQSAGEISELEKLTACLHVHAMAPGSDEELDMEYYSKTESIEQATLYVTEMNNRLAADLEKYGTELLDLPEADLLLYLHYVLRLFGLWIYPAPLPTDLSVNPTSRAATKVGSNRRASRKKANRNTQLNEVIARQTLEGKIAAATDKRDHLKANELANQLVGRVEKQTVSSSSPSVAPIGNAMPNESIPDQNLRTKTNSIVNVWKAEDFVFQADTSSVFNQENMRLGS